MRRIGSSDSLGALISTCPTTDEQSPRNSHFCNFQPLMEGLDDEGSVEEYCHVAEKKRRLSIDQVKALEKTFEVENKLEPERKVKLAQELGLQPRQVAVWFQNRRARWKTKQLERDYGVLKANYEALKANYETLVQDNDGLRKEVKELKGRLLEQNSNGYLSVREEMEPLMAEKTNPSTELTRSEPALNSESFKESCNGGDDAGAEASLFPDNLKDGSSDSDSSAILNEDHSPNAAISSPEILHSNQLIVSPPPSAFKCNALPSSSPRSALNCFGQLQKSFSSPPQQFVKMEEHNFFSGDEACNLFSDEQAPTLPWYCSDQWS